MFFVWCSFRQRLARCDGRKKSCDGGLSQRHGIKIPVEEFGLAVGEVVGYESIKAASRMIHAVVMFVDSVDKVNSVVEKGVV